METMGQFIKEQQIALLNLKEKAQRIESENYEKDRVLRAINGEIETIGIEMKHHQNELETLLIQKKFVEDILSTKFKSEVEDIRRHNDVIADLMKVREIREKKIENLMELKR